MLLVQKPPQFHLASTPVRHHRRNPSSPPVVHVQPTHIPGLLSLSKLASTTPKPKDKRKTLEANSDPFLVPKQQQQQQQQQRQPRKRQQQQPINIPAPASSSSTQQPAARSVPLPHHRPAKRIVEHDLLPAFNFPICDDLSDNEQPSTPTRPKQRSAPKQHTPAFSPSPAPASTKRRPRNHKRAPSDSGMVFNMSSDESGSEAVPNNDINALFKNLSFSRNLRTPPPAQREAMYEAMAYKEVHGYFANSSFQNSPSPEDLPDPLLF